MKILRFLALPLVAFVCLFVSSGSVSALSSVGSGTANIVACSLRTSSGSGAFGGSPSNGGCRWIDTSAYSLWFARIVMDLNTTIPANSAITFTLRYAPSSGSDMSSFRGVSGAGMISSNITTAGGSVYQTVTFMTSNATNSIWFGSSDFIYGDTVWTMDVSALSYTTFAKELSQADIESLRSSIVAEIQAQNSYLVGVNNRLDQIGNTLNSQTSSINNTITNVTNAQTQQQHNDAEENRNREDNARTEMENQSTDAGEVEGAGGIGSFFSIFGSANCSSIPTVASWIHLQNSTVCPAMPNSIRTTGTAIITSILGLILLRRLLNKEATEKDG